MKTLKNKIDYEKMFSEILELVETDFVFDMEPRTMPNSKGFSQKEAKKMAQLLSKIYSIAHCIHCKACQKRYE